MWFYNLTKHALDKEEMINYPSLDKISKLG